jgi:NAD(P)-dependent dehydrogenase (short-subunit alcohol dehydrogenase family)
MNEETLPEAVMPSCPSRQLLKGQKALVTGANSGTGRAVAVYLAKEGADVVVNYVAGDETANQVVAEIEATGRRGLAIRADVSSEEQVQPMFRQIIDAFGTIDILVNSICPGASRTPINTAAWETPEVYAELMKLIPYNRIGETEDIARATAWMASDDADYVQGVSFFVDGGMTLYPGFAEGG